MQTKFSALDQLKASWLLEEAIEKLNFLSTLQPDYIASSESAKHEINKTISEQRKLETQYEELLKVRSTLTGVSDKEKLEELQNKIKETGHLLKENTVRMGELFKESPSFDKDTGKVKVEKTELIEILEDIFSVYQKTLLVEPQAKLIDALAHQDSVRQLGWKEKRLMNEIKDLETEIKKEEEELRETGAERQSYIENKKRNLVQTRSDAVFEGSLQAKELQAKEELEKRLNDQKLKDDLKRIEEDKKNKAMEDIANNKVKEYMRRKEEENKALIREWNGKFEETKEAIDHKVEQLQNEKAKALATLQKLKEEFGKADAVRKEREKKAIEKDEARQKKAEEEAKLEEAVRKIQEQFQTWKDGKQLPVPKTSTTKKNVTGKNTSVKTKTGKSS